VRHAIKQKEAGVDLIIANGHEAAGHTGEITTMVLVPQVVEAVAPVPYWRRAALPPGGRWPRRWCWGAQGVWTGSVWLTSAESELDPVVRDKLVAASSEQTARTRCITASPRGTWSRRTPRPGCARYPTRCDAAADHGNHGRADAHQRALHAEGDGARQLVTSPPARRSG